MDPFDELDSLPSVGELLLGAQEKKHKGARSLPRRKKRPVVQLPVESAVLEAKPLAALTQDDPVQWIKEQLSALRDGSRARGGLS
jgi:hypothetical protein